MKRCPECEFLYYDDQDRCDIDGTRLNFTTKLPTLPAEAAQKKALRSTLVFLLLATIILGILLFILYPPQLHISTSSPAAKVTPANVLDTKTDSQFPAESSPHRTSTPSPRPAAHSRDPFALMDTRSERSDNSLPPAKPKVTIIAPANRSVEAKPAVNQVTTAHQAAPMTQKPMTPAYSTPSPSHPVAVATATPKPVTQNANKDSKFNSMMKKAGRFLKKPF